ncbi:MAG: hypothetical protein OYH76_11940 [Defluviicoccus sp.]|nr:hypothetical protein [Defluviicoccus sp.]MDE0276598.1 hypothetical protein [Defluviicoccus sp.]
MIEPGAEGIYEVVVEDRHTAHALGNDGVRVVATPMLAHFCALAAQRAIAPALSKGEVAVPLRTTLAHLRAAAPGSRIVAAARVTEVDGQEIGLAVEARGGGGTLMAGTVVWTARDRASLLVAAGT